ncbi:sigma-70 family RNA polymerase sigma factor [Pontibacter sp. HSC-36F09]|uniref:sigma-70 family RNA polymerase sigma factor n=1 Tax=Pontibacter sp. HSC-36F09 TaxID=2910966 RepID=UPI00209E12FC|nr:sigma-70 family RNA polymerase sigma factor [Pontibacter sp. HSC-36F09]MCP2043866.1 RNA polymerase sigma-70 factor (ECF subfamily) [Pontibacter sp. HSC-36F09]
MHKTEAVVSYAPDSEIVSKIKAGEKDLFEVLIRRHNGALYKVGRSFGLLHDDVQDLMQEAHIAAYLNLGKFESRAAYKTWLIRIMLNKCYHLTMEKSHKSKSDFSEVSHTGEVNFTEKNTSSDGHREVLNRELGRVLEECIEQLAPEYRTVFVLRELEGLNVNETASVMSITEANVKVRLNRAKSMLRKKLESWYPKAAVYEFNLIYCDQVVERVFQRI